MDLLKQFQLVVHYGATAVSIRGSSSVGLKGNNGGMANARLLGGGAGGGIASGKLFDSGSAVISGSNGGNATSYSGGARRRRDY